MQFNPWNNVTLPVVPFYVSRRAHDQLCELELSGPERLHRAKIDDNRFIARWKAYQLISMCQLAQIVNALASVRERYRRAFNLPGSGRVTDNPECKGFVYGANHGGANDSDTYSNYRYENADS
jgi:hypothetical protein